MPDGVLVTRYRIVDKLGYGGYSTIWLARDDQLRRYTAIKVGVSNPSVPQRESHIGHTLSQHRPASPSSYSRNELAPSLLNEFKIQGSNGTHTYYATAPAQGNLKEASFSCLFPIRVARALAAKLGIAESYVHSKEIIRGDIHLRNVLTKLPSTFDDLSIEQFREKYEALFELDTPLSYASDIWSLGTAIWEIMGMKFISSEEETVDEIVAQQIDVLGTQDFPAAWRKQWERPSTSEENDNEDIPRRPTGDRETWPPLEQAFEEFVQKYRRKREELGILGEDETRAFLDLMRGMLRFHPEDSLKIHDILRSEWIIGWALPE
ncbi:kinase-like protein [Corynespora cassiicola Philippines]|uniref:non-specific serine/threonine protein kinase n=1 Tax=Corynespora cassiicola Philippines TaxID=1448308 RepID=A0A2T2NBF5_CORCC|nr:kinase-like protein [Corynespora cassiicola Philippines]